MHMEAEKCKKKNIPLVVLISKEFFDKMWPSPHKQALLKTITSFRKCLHVWLDLNEDDVKSRSLKLLSTRRSFRRLRVEELTLGLPWSDNTQCIDKVFSLLVDTDSNTEYDGLNNYAIDDEEETMRLTFLDTLKLFSTSGG